MRITRALVVVLGVALAASACSSGENGKARGVSPVTALPSTCEGFGSVPDAGQVTFAKGSLAFGVTPEGAGIHCITGVAGVNPLFWGPRGDFVIDVGFSLAQVISESGRVVIEGPGETPRFHGISRPEGDTALYIAVDGTSLAKVPTAGGELQDISFLRRHDEALFHPSGKQIAVIGETQKGIYGVWLVTNEGTKPHLVVPHRDEDEFYALSFSSDGGTLYYMDDQHFTFELRAVDLSTFKEGIALPESTLLVKEKEPLTVAASPFTDDLLTYRQGSCEAGFKTFVLEDETARQVGSGLGDTQPVGWLPDDRLILAAADDLCDPEGTLDIYVVEGDQADLLVEDVGPAAVRVALPAAPDPVSGPVGTSAD